MNEFDQDVRGYVDKIIKKKSFAFLETLMKDGSPHVIPVCIDVEGSTIVVNTPEEE
jgi:hypothetical protein